MENNTMDPTSTWLLPRSTAIGWLNEEDTMSSKHLWWGPFTSTFCEHCIYNPEEDPFPCTDLVEHEILLKTHFNSPIWNVPEKENASSKMK